MISAGAAVFIWSQTTSPDPLNLPLVRPGSVAVKPGALVDLRSGSEATVEQAAQAADGVRFVYLGESHDNAEHHRMQAAIIRALAERGRHVIVGFEMFTRPVQSALNPWTLGWWTEHEFIERSDWKVQWGFEFALYRPIFDEVRKRRLPMIALNVPRDWVRAVGRGGPSALPEEAAGQIPRLDLSNKQHRSVFDAMMGGHPMTGSQGENVYAAQVLWDTAMADSALKYLESHPPHSKTVVVVIAGSGHVVYGQGINYRVWQRTGERGLTVTMAESRPEQDPAGLKVSRGLGDFVFVTPPVPRGP